MILKGPCIRSRGVKEHETSKDKEKKETTLSERFKIFFVGVNVCRRSGTFGQDYFEADWLII